MEKPFRLPKDFAEKWVSELRSGKYNQAKGKLVKIDESGKNGYCCLGVAANMCGLSNKTIEHNSYLQKWAEEVKNGFEIPDELLNAGWCEDENFLPKILTILNDGFNKHMYENDILPENYIFRNIDIAKHFINDDERVENCRLNFTQIANFIEDNVEFY